MTAEEFRSLALALPAAVESVHGGHPDFRIEGRVFASLGAPDDDWGMVALSPDDQARFLADDAHAFRPAAGAWGARGYTCVRLASAETAVVREAVVSAFGYILRKKSRKK